MILKRIKSDGLAHISYFLSSEKKACVIDPRRDAKTYLQKAWKEEADIMYVFETHRNEDYVIGSMELADAVNLEIYHGPNLNWKYGNTLVDGQEFKLGLLIIKALHTPGHTDESTSYVVYDTSSGNEPVLVFTGDTLFVGDTGRIDMYGPDESRRLAGNLYDSIFNKLLSLGDQTIILPSHGAGSVCGGAINAREHSTIGLERKENPALQHVEKNDFIKYKLAEHHYYVPYFKKMEQYNLEGPLLLRKVPRFKPLNSIEFNKIKEKGGVVLDTRHPASFGGMHVKGSYNIWLEGLPSYAGWIVPYDKPLLLIVKDFKNLNDAHKYLLRLGYDNIAGYLVGGITTWYSENYPHNNIALITASDLKKYLDQNTNLLILDVRSISEREEGYIEGSKHIYVGELQERINEIPKDIPIATFCGNGSRASLAASILKKAGFENIHNVLGSMAAWRNAGYPLVKD